MSYADQANLAADPQFYGRLTACCTEQAAVFKDDGRPEIAQLGKGLYADPGLTSWFVWPVATQPGFTDEASLTDGQILAAVQNVWPTVAALHYPATP